MEIVQERLEREYDLDLIITAPTVVYKAMLTDGEEVTVDNPCLLPEAARREYISEPYVRSAVFPLIVHHLVEQQALTSRSWCFPWRESFVTGTW